MIQKIPLPKSQSQWQTLFLVYIIIIAILSLTPTDSSTLPVKHIDKVGHFLAYVLMALIALMSFRGQNGRRTMTIILTFLIAFLFEWGQSFIPGRVASLTDGITNILGLLTGLVLFWLYNKIT